MMSNTFKAGELTCELPHRDQADEIHLDHAPSLLKLADLEARERAQVANGKPNKAA